MDALARLLGWKLSLHGVPVQGQITVISAGGPANRYPSGTPVTFERVSGHRDGNNTSCPGEVLYGQLADLRARAAGYAGPIAGLTARATRRVRGAAPVNVSGELRFADGSSPGGAGLDVEFQSGGSAWTRVAGAICGPDGAWTAAVALPHSGHVRAVFPGDATRPRLESAPVAVTVTPSLTIAVRSPRVRRRRAVRVTGTMSPATPRVTIRFERRVGRRWLHVQRKRILVTDGAYSTIVRPPVAGRYRVSVTGGGLTRRRRIVAR
jgi:hypothetical protein